MTAYIKAKAAMEGPAAPADTGTAATEVKEVKKEPAIRRVPAGQAVPLERE